MPDLVKQVEDYRVNQNLTQEQVAGLIGVSTRTYQNIIKNGEIKRVDILEKIEKLVNSNTQNVSRETYQQRLLNKKNSKSGRNSVPFYDAEATAGITETEMSPIHAPSGTIDIGDLLHDSQAAIRIYGNSMLPNYPPGCVVGLHQVTENFIEPGEVYVIETGGKRMLKRLFYRNDEADSEMITLYSDNTMKFDGGSRHGKLAYPPFDINKKEIGNLFAVTGVIKRNTNSIIMHRNNKP